MGGALAPYKMVLERYDPAHKLTFANSLENGENQKIRVRLIVLFGGEEDVGGAPGECRVRNNNGHSSLAVMRRGLAHVAVPVAFRVSGVLDDLVHVERRELEPGGEVDHVAPVPVLDDLETTLDTLIRRRAAPDTNHDTRKLTDLVGLADII